MMMKRYTVPALVVILSMIMGGCFFNYPCIEGVGEFVEETRDVDDFYSVSNSSFFDVYVTQGDEFSVVVKARENLLSLIETYRSGGTLVIGTVNYACIRSTNPIEVYVTMPEIEELGVSGSGSLYADKIAGDELELHLSGSGRILVDTLTGEAISLGNSGSGRIQLDETASEFLDVKLSGSGSIDFGMSYMREANVLVSGSGHVKGDIYDAVVTDLTLSSSGEILLYGDSQEVETQHSGSGRIDALDLLAVDVKTRSSGSGNTYVNASGSLDVTIIGSGSVIYLGEPEVINYRITGSGNLRVY